MNTICLLGFQTLHFNTMVRWTYATNTLVMPAAFLGTALLARWLSDGRTLSPCHRRVAFLYAVLALTLVSLRIYATHIEPRLLQVRHVTITSEKLTRPFTLLHLSDIQSPAIGGYEEKVFERIRALNPDLIVHTGDLLQPVAPATYGSELPKLARLFRTLNPPLGMYAVQGDTTGPLVNATPTDTGGITFLRNEEALIHAGGIPLRLYGLTLRSSTARTWARGGLHEWLDLAPDALNIVMGHRPDYILKINDLPFELCLAGHTHGGQIRLPFWGPIVTFSSVPRKWARGFHKINNTFLNVSAGIGSEHAGNLPAIRLNCPPEMTLIHFMPAT